jgi:hypothetical protein
MTGFEIESADFLRDVKALKNRSGLPKYLVFNAVIRFYLLQSFLSNPVYLTFFEHNFRHSKNSGVRGCGGINCPLRFFSNSIRQFLANESFYELEV